MFSPYRRQVLATLFLRRDEQFHVRELERLTGISAGSLHRELKAMAQAGLLTREKSGHQVYYAANPECDIYDELASIFRKTMGLSLLLKEALSPIDDRIDTAFVFGSVASGRQTANSDLDICVFGEVSLLDVVKALGTVRVTLNREINPVVMTMDEFSKLARNGDRFANRVLIEPKLFIKANADDIAELVEDRSAGET
jgi:predicted nucleotidyltransferase